MRTATRLALATIVVLSLLSAGTAPAAAGGECQSIGFGSDCNEDDGCDLCDPNCVCALDDSSLLATGLALTHLTA